MTSLAAISTARTDSRYCIPNARGRIRAMSQHDSRSLVLRAVQNCDQERLVRGVCGLADGTIAFDNVRQSDREVRAVVRSGDKRYAVTLTRERAFCGCKDSTFRHSLC